MKKIFATLFVMLCTIAMLIAAPLTADEKQQLDITQRAQKIRMKGKLPLYFSDAEDGKPIKGAKVTFEDTVYTTDKYGFVTLPQLEDEDYTFTVAKEGYISEEIDFEVRAGFIPNYRFTLSKELKSGYLRIVLEWGDRPNDLDLHLEQEGGYHISYRDMHTSSDGHAMLDRDDICCYGPETITVNEYALNKNYFVYVVDYSNSCSSNSPVLGNSRATVKIYDDDTLKEVFFVPVGTRGNRWNVCTIKNGEVTENNTVVEIF